MLHLTFFNIVSGLDGWKRVRSDITTQLVSTLRGADSSIRSLCVQSVFRISIHGSCATLEAVISCLDALCVLKAWKILLHWLKAPEVTTHMQKLI